MALVALGLSPITFSRVLDEYTLYSFYPYGLLIFLVLLLYE